MFHSPVLGESECCWPTLRVGGPQSGGPQSAQATSDSVGERVEMHTLEHKETLGNCWSKSDFSWE